MKPHTQAVREAQAWERIENAVRKQAEAAGVKVQGLDATHRDASLQQLFRMEALADFLEGLPVVTVGPEQEGAPDVGAEAKTQEAKRERKK